MARLISENDFDQVVLKATKPVVVDFFAEWCGPCRQQTPVIERWSAANHEKCDVVKVDVDQAQALASKYGIMSIPTLIVFSGGKEKARVLGFQDEKGLTALLAKAAG